MLLRFNFARLLTFKTWPEWAEQPPILLAEAGFYYNGEGDKTECFSCGGALIHWREEHIPWKQHALYFGHCKFLRLRMGVKFIERVIKEYEHDQDYVIYENLVRRTI